MPGQSAPPPERQSAELENMWKLKEGSVTLCLDGEGKPIKLGQGGYGSVYLARWQNLTHLSVNVLADGRKVSSLALMTADLISAGVDVRLSQQVLTRLQRVHRGSCEGATAWPSRWWR